MSERKEALLRPNPEPEGARLLKAARAAFKAEQHAEAKRLLVQALENGAEKSVCYLILARLSNKLRDWGGALRHWQWLNERAPENLEYLLQVGRAQHRLGQFNEAMNSLRGVLALQPDHAEARERLENIGRAHKERPVGREKACGSQLKIQSNQQRDSVARIEDGTVGQGAEDQLVSLDEKIKSLFSQPGQLELGKEVLAELVRAERYEVAAQVFECLEAYYVLEGKLEELAELAIVGLHTSSG